MAKTTISARVPVQFKNDFSNWCKSNGTTVSEHLQRVFENVDTNTFLPKSESVVVDKETRGTLLSLGGGSAIAILVYKGIVALLTDKYPLMEIEQVKLLAVSGAATTGLLGGIGLHKLLNL